MKYRLKDREFQRKVDELTNQEFSKSLREGIDPTDYYRIFRIKGFGSISVLLNQDALEEVLEYDPTTWNEWPSVEPPEKTLLRIEIITERIGEGTPEPSGGKVRCRGCATYSHGFWMLGEKITVKPRETVRFRPWDDHDEEEKK